jgi:hypothetical protein
MILGRDDHDRAGGFSREARHGHQASEKQTHESSSVNSRYPPGLTQDGERVKKGGLRRITQDAC